MSTVLDTTTPFGHYAPTGAQKHLLRFTRAMPAWGPTYRIALACRKLIKWLNDGPIDLETFGCKIRFYPWDNITERRALMTPNRFDPEERAHLSKALAPGGVFVDLGANAGLYTLALAPLVGPDGVVISVDPQAAVSKRLSFSVAASDLPQVRLVRAGVSDVDGELMFQRNAGNLGESKMVDTDQQATDGAHEAKAVPVKRLMTILAEQGVTRVDALKIDVEGHEDRALIPFFTEAEDSLLPKVIVAENATHRWEQDWLAAATKRGYTISHQDKRNLLLER